jgi:hypothetical protein
MLLHPFIFYAGITLNPKERVMSRLSHLSIVAGIVATASAVGLLAIQSDAATAAAQQAAPSPCVCSSLEKLEYRPINPAEAIGRIYVGQCQCGAMSCVVTTGALQCSR